MPSQRNPWIGSLYTLSALFVITATYVLPRLLKQDSELLRAIAAFIQAQEVQLSEMTPANLIPVGGDQAPPPPEEPPHTGISVPQPPSAPIDPATPEAQAKPPAAAQLSAPPRAPRARPMVTDQSVVADN